MALSYRDYQKYLKFASADLPAPKQENLVMMRFIFADNLIGRSQMAWHPDALDSIAKRLIGMPFTVNHDWDEVGEAHGVIYDAQRMSFPDAPQKFTNNYAEKLNKGIIKSDGWLPVAGKVAFQLEPGTDLGEETAETLNRLALGTGNKVSIGGFRTTEIWCPLCQCPFEDRTICGHLPPSPWYEDTDVTAPYTIRKDINDMGEASLVLIPNAPSAGAITNDIAEYFKDYV
jgi:hypothetical protein